MNTASTTIDTATIQTLGLGKRFGQRAAQKWALRDCTLEIPEGRICGLVGSNGAGKTTLLRMLAGLAKPTAGTISVFGQPPADERDFLRSIGFLAQNIPLYPRWSAADHLAMGAHLNDSWDGETTRNRLQSLNISLDQRVETLSGGQRAQVGLALALGKRPRVLLLDEPFAALDPLARRDFLSILVEAVADGGLTVILSSHLVADLERICDFLVLVDKGELQLADEIEDILAAHWMLTAPRRELGVLEREHTVLRVETTARETRVWARLQGPLHDPGWQRDPLGLEDIVLAHMGRDRHPRGGRVEPRAGQLTIAPSTAGAKR
jgi:ABC-2 type transport system ATP-binding protein